MTAPAPGEAVPCQWRKRPAVLWGLLWTGDNPDSIRRFAVSPEGTGLEVWNDQERCWIPCPAGHVVMKGVLGEFYPVSEAGIKQGYDPATGPVTGTPGQAAAIPEAAVQAAAEVLYRDYDSEFDASHLSWQDFAGQARKVLDAAAGTAPQPAPEGKRVTLKLSETQPAPDLAAAIQDIIDRYPEQQPVPDLAKVLDDFTRTVINVSDRPALTAMARNIRKNHGMEAL